MQYNMIFYDGQKGGEDLIQYAEMDFLSSPIGLHGDDRHCSRI